MAAATLIAIWTANGTYTWTCPSAVSSAQVEVWGAGGGGAAASTASEAGGGGGGGEYAAEPTQSVTSGTGYTVIVGAAGTGGTSSNNGVGGGNSTFNTTTVVAHGGGGGTANLSSFGPTTGGGPGGSGSSNTTHFNGGTGGGYAAKSDGAGGGGGSGGTGSAGNNGTESTSSTGGAGATAVTGGGPGGNGANAVANANGSAPVSGPGGGGGGGWNSGSATGGNGFDGQARITWSMNSPAVLSAATTGGTYTWTAPAGITSVSWTITGTASFNGNSSSGNQTVTPGTAYTITVAAGGSLTISWGAANDIPQIAPGPSWFSHFKPGLARPRPPVPPFFVNKVDLSGGATVGGAVGSGNVQASPPPMDMPRFNPGPTWMAIFKPGMKPKRPAISQPVSGPNPANLPNLSDVPQILPGPTWLAQFKPGLPKPKPQSPPTSTVSNPGSAAIGGVQAQGSVTVNPTSSGSANIAGVSAQGTVKVPIIIQSGSAALGGVKSQGTVGVPVVIQTGNASFGGIKANTPGFNNDLPNIKPGPTWLDKFKPGMPKVLKIPGGPQYIGARAASTIAGVQTLGQVIQYLPFPQFALNLKIEILINGTWLDITSFVYNRNDIVITRGLPDETQSVTPSQMTLTLDNRDGRFSPGNPAGLYFPYLVRNTQVRLSVVNQASADGTPYSGYRFWGEVSSFPPRWDASQSDVYCDITVSGVLRRYIQGAPLGSTMYQYYTTLTGNNTPYAYWPAEDGSKATEIASALPTVSAATFTGNPQFSSDASFGGSDPLPVISSSIWHGVTSAAANPPGTGSITNHFPGTYHWTAPPGVTQVTGVVCTGAGGGGGDQDTTIGGGGGGGGGVGKASTISVTPGVTYTYVVGAGGAAGAGGTGSDGADSTFTGDSATVTGKGGKGGSFGGTGGAGGAGTTFNGGHGGSGASASSFTFGDSLSGNSGASGGGSGGSAGSQSVLWTAPAGVTTVNVSAIGAGGGGQGGGAFGAGDGGGGGGGGGYATGTIDVTPGNSYTFEAGNGGNGGSNGVQGDAGGHSGVNGDSLGCFGNGGTQGSGAGGGGNGGTFIVGSGSGTNGSSGGNGAAPGGGFGGGGGGGGGYGGTGNGQNAHPPSTQTRQPGSGGGNGGGGGWGTSSYPGGGGATTGSTGGSYGGGGGGGGSITANTGKVGGGGGAGIVNWNWTQTGVPTGGGGGSSAGTSATGTSGSSSGTGGTAPSGGGNGGNAGSSPTGSVPGGGGGGGVPDSGSGATTPGAGAPGQVSFSWSGGTTSPVAADIIRFCLHVDSAGAADGAILLQALTYGTVATLNLVYHTGGNLELIGINSSSVTVFDSGLVNFGANGTPLYMSLELTGSGSNVVWKLTGIVPGASVATATATGTIAGSVGNVSDILVDPGGTVTDSGTSIGQITVQTYADTLVNLSTIVNGYAGETVAARLSRLCSAQGIGFTLVGNASDTPQAGPQQDDSFVNILQSCADLDRGQLYETRDQFGIGYRTRVDMQGQNPVLTADYSLATLAGQLTPTQDDQFTRNSITVSRNGGASAVAQQSSGSLSILTPPNGVGLYSQALTVQAFSDSQLANLVQWLLTVGTVDEYRYPGVSFDMARTEVQDLFGTIPALDIGDFVQVINPPTFLQVQPISQLAWGFTETLNTFKWIIEINTVPESPYSEGNPPTW